MSVIKSVHEYEVRPRKDVLPFGRLWYDTPDNAIGYAMHSSRSHDAVIRVYDENITACDRDQLPSTLILDSKIPPVLAVRAA